MRLPSFHAAQLRVHGLRVRLKRLLLIPGACSSDRIPVIKKASLPLTEEFPVDAVWLREVLAATLSEERNLSLNSLHGWGLPVQDEDGRLYMGIWGLYLIP